MAVISGMIGSIGEVGTSDGSSAGGLRHSGAVPARACHQIHAGDGLARILAHPLDRDDRSGAARGTRPPGSGRESPGAFDPPDPWPERDPNWPFISPAPPRLDRGPLALALLIAAFLATAGVVLWQARAAAHRGDLLTLHFPGSRADD